MSDIGQAAWAASSAWLAVGQLDDAQKPTERAMHYAKRSSQAAARGDVTGARRDAGRAIAEKELHM